MEEYITLIGNFGFPIALVFYFLVRFENKIDKLVTSIEKLSDLIKYHINDKA